MLMKTSLGTLFAAAALTSSHTWAVTATDSALDNHTAHVTTFTAMGEYHASGNDDAFAEYGIAGFNFEASDFGGQVTDVNSVTLTLRHDPRGFTNGSEVRFYYSSDDFGSGYSGLLFDASGTNDPDGVNPADFTSLVDLGTYAFMNKPFGDITNYSLDLSAIGGSLVDEINNGSDFQVLIAAPTNDSTITFQAAGTQFSGNVGTAPELTIDANIVPEPASIALLVAGATAAVTIGRRR